MKKLTEDVKIALEAQLKCTRNVHERNRLLVVLNRNKGYLPELIADILELSRRTVFLYLEEYESEQKTKHKPKNGRSCKLTTEDLTNLLTHLEKVTYSKAASICSYIEETFDKIYSSKGVIHLLKRNGFAYKKPLKVPTRLSVEKQEEFIKFYEELKTNLFQGEEIYFMDAVHPEYQSQAAFGWIKKGVRKTLQTTAKQTRLHFVGALCLKGMNLITKECSTVGQEEVIDFLKHLEGASKAPTIHVIADNARSNKNKALNLYLESSKIRMHYLPPYSPNLNPIERVWKVMRENTTYNTYYENFEQFTEKIRSFFSNIQSFKDVLSTRVNDNFQRIILDSVQYSK